ncbi:MAG: hypothetical protein K0R46_3520 [Herbinix sp.]|jgi:hypothetical protein|nr:hypothetical protein [Herbinix sp.]
MEDRKTIFDYIAQVFCIFGISMIIMMCFSVIVGDAAKGYSVMFATGGAGVPVPIMAQFLLLSAINVALRYVFLTDKLIKHMSAVKRILCTVLSVLLTVIACIILFGWFPVNLWQAWLLFLGSFAVCFSIGTFITTVKNNMENKMLAEGLAKMKEQWGEENGTEE